MRKIPRVLLAAALAPLAWAAISNATEANDNGWLGVWIGTDTKTTSDSRHHPRRVIYIMTVDQGGPAEAAGLLPLDVILEIDGRPVNSARDAVCLVKAAQPGHTLLLAIKRQMEVRTIQATLSEWPEGIPPSNLDCPPVVSFKGKGEGKGFWDQYGRSHSNG